MSRSARHRVSPSPRGAGGSPARNAGEPPAPRESTGELDRISRPASLVAQVEQLLRDALTAGRFVGGRLPTEVELAEQLGVSRETVRRATETLQREGLLVKFRRKGTFTHPPQMPERIEAAPSTLLGYLQAAYPARDDEEAVTRAIG